MKLFNYKVIYMFVLAFFVFVSCATDDHANVSLRLSGDLSAYNSSNNKINYSMVDRFLMFFSKPAFATWYDVRNGLTLTVSGDAMETITVAIPDGATSYSIRVQSGTNRKFVVRSTDAVNSGAVPHPWGGSATVDLSPGADVDLTLKMLPMSTMAYASADGPIYFGWDASGYTQNYMGSATARIYRATAQEGPYTLLQEISFSTGSGSDSDIVSGKTYYYKVAILTIYGEGEMSDYLAETP